MARYGKSVAAVVSAASQYDKTVLWITGQFDSRAGGVFRGILHQYYGWDAIFGGGDIIRFADIRRHIEIFHRYPSKTTMAAAMPDS